MTRDLSALGTLAYIAYETRRLFEDMKLKGQKFRPLEVTALVEPEAVDQPRRLGAGPHRPRPHGGLRRFLGRMGRFAEHAGGHRRLIHAPRDPPPKS